VEDKERVMPDKSVAELERLEKVYRHALETAQGALSQVKSASAEGMEAGSEARLAAGVNSALAAVKTVLSGIPGTGGAASKMISFATGARDYVQADTVAEQTAGLASLGGAVTGAAGESFARYTDTFEFTEHLSSFAKTTGDLSEHGPAGTGLREAGSLVGGVISGIGSAAKLGGSAAAGTPFNAVGGVISGLSEFDKSTDDLVRAQDALNENRQNSELTTANIELVIAKLKAKHDAITRLLPAAPGNMMPSVSSSSAGDMFSIGISNTTAPGGAAFVPSHNSPIQLGAHTMPLNSGGSAHQASLDAAQHEATAHTSATNAATHEHEAQASATKAAEHEHEANASATKTATHEHDANAAAAKTATHEHDANASATKAATHEHDANASATKAADHEHQAQQHLDAIAALHHQVETLVHQIEELRAQAEHAAAAAQHFAG